MASMYEMRLACPSCKDFFPASEWDKKTFSGRGDWEYWDDVEGIMYGDLNDNSFICPACSVESRHSQIYHTPIETAKMDKNTEGIICPGCHISSSAEEWNKEAEEYFMPPFRKIDFSPAAWGGNFACPSCHQEYDYQEIEERQFAPKENESALELLKEEW